jgi:ADP-ribose pyrophosphatase YjhB (NUDIX family)
MNKYSKFIGNIIYWSAWPVLFFYLRNSKRSRVIVTDGNHVLIIKNWIGPGSYTLPGGGLRNNELPEVGVIRELEEETGIVVGLNDLKLIMPKRLTTENGHSYQYIGYLLKVNRQPEITRQKFEIAEIKWVSISEALGKYKLTSMTKELITTVQVQIHREHSRIK